MKTLLSLFDYSGQWSQPFFKNGWNVIQWEIKLAEFMDLNLISSCEDALELFEDVDGILAAVPCTDFSASGAHAWKAKDEAGITAASLELAYQVLRLVNLYRPTDPDYEGTFFWAIENPKGRLGKLTGMGGAKMYFDPYEYAGHLSPSTEDLHQLDKIRKKNGMGVTKEEAKHIIQMEAYTKETGLWGEFNSKLKKSPIAPAKGSPYGSPLMRVGGKGAKTKEFRSNTPLGFSYAFYEANKEYSCTLIDNPVQLNLF